MSAVTIKDITRALEAWAPRATQQSYDNVGLQVGDPNQEVDACLIALDLIPSVIQEAIDIKANLIITHHPLIFRPVKSLATTHWHGALINQLIKHDIALYCIHTNLDAAYDGVSYALAVQLGLSNVTFLRPTPNAMVKLITFVPTTHVDPVRKALKEAGAGHIGEYQGCSFVTEGTGYFSAGEKANPTIGHSGGQEEQVQEARIEVELPGWLLSSATRALKVAHPYEEVAFDVIPMEKADTRTGMGAIGTLPEPITLQAFLRMAAKNLDSPSAQFVGDTDTEVQRVAVCGGSGSDLIRDAMSHGADVYLTADVTYHRFFEVLDTNGKAQMALVNIVHYETEACAEILLVNWLSERFNSLSFHRTTIKTSPIQHFVVQTSNAAS